MKYLFQNVRALQALRANPNEILKVVADANYSIIHFYDGRKLTLAKTLKECEGIFEPYPFYRIHRSTIVNLQYGRQLKKNKLIMANSHDLNISRRRLDGLIDSIKKNKSSVMFTF